MDKGITLEEYLGTAKDAGVTIDYGKSDLYSEEQMIELVNQIKCQFANSEWKDCKLLSIKYAGDDANSEKNIKFLSELKEGKEYKSTAEFLIVLKSGNNVDSILDPNKEYTDYQFWLGCDKKDSWDIVSWGY